MNKQIQDILWASLSKEERKRHRDGYKAEVKALSYNSGFNDALESIFGHHNLTSDTEPKVMLMVERQKVSDLLQWANECTDNTEEAYIVKNTIECLFGDKCLPDTPNTPISGELKPQEVESQPKFKYNIGDLVTYRGKVKKIKHRYSGGGLIMYDVTLLNGQSPLTFEESDLEPYTEPETKDSDNRQALYDALCELESASKKVRKALISLQ